MRNWQDELETLEREEGRGGHHLVQARRVVVAGQEGRGGGSSRPPSKPPASCDTPASLGRPSGQQLYFRRKGHAANLPNKYGSALKKTSRNSGPRHAGVVSNVLVRRRPALHSLSSALQHHTVQSAASTTKGRPRVSLLPFTS